MIKNNGPSVRAIARVVKRERKERMGLSQAAFAEIAGVPLSAVEIVERSGCTNIKKLWRMVDAMGMNWLEFWTAVDDLPF